MLYYTILYCAILYYTTLYYTVCIHISRCAHFDPLIHFNDWVLVLWWQVNTKFLGQPLRYGFVCMAEEVPDEELREEEEKEKEKEVKVALHIFEPVFSISP